MTATQRIKNGLMAYLGELSLDGVTTVDANQRAEFILPIMAVDVPACDAFNQSLPMVNNATAVVTLRAHSGDEDDASISSWIESVEIAMRDKAAITSLLYDHGMVVHNWTYSGSVQEWDESVLHVTFPAECIVQMNA